jgi:hypothetical protein
MNWIVEFIFPYRLHRLAFLLRFIAASVVPPIILFTDVERDSILTVGFEIGLVIYNILFLFLPRIRDLTLSGWWLLALGIPFVNTLLALYLFFGAPKYRLAEPVPTYVEG